MEMQKILKPRIILEVITFSVIITAMINCFLGINSIRKVKNNQNGLKAYYLMDFRLFGRGSLDEGRGRVCGRIEI